MNYEEIVIPSATGIIGAVTTWFFGRKKETADISTVQLENSQRVIDMVTAMNEKLEAKVDSLSKKVDELMGEIELLREENHNLRLGLTPKKGKTT